MKRPWLSISAISALGIAGVLGISAMAIANKMDYDVLSYQVLILDDKRITIRLIFGVSNPSRFNIDIWNQQYDVFIAGQKTLEITSKHQYRVFAGTTSSIPIDVGLKWKDFYDHSAALGSYTQGDGIANLPIVIRGTFAAKIGIFRLMRLPVRMVAPLRDFLP